MSKKRIAEGIAAGAAGGLLASWVMNQYQAGWKKLTHQDQQQPRPSEQPTVKVAEAVTSAIAHHHLSEQEQKKAGPVVHYAFGTAVGALYGGLAAWKPKIAVGFGMPFGAAVWAAADNTMLPLLGLAKAPTEYPASMHAYALTSHLVYGAVTEAVRRVL
jgi:putative membrane protein